MQKQPIEGLELLRGLCALAVALFHCLEWGQATEMYNWGLYGVYIFFVISGAVLYYNYNDLQAIGPFLFKRFARLAPLYVLALVLTTLGLHLTVGLGHLLNASLLFGFANPGSSSLVGGGWSLGIEFALYALFPALLAFTQSRRAVLALLAFYLLRITVAESTVIGPMEKWWSAYTQVGSFAFFFFGGMVVAKLMMSGRVDGWPLWALGLLAALVIFGIPMHTPVLTGPRAALYAALCLPLVAWFFRVRIPGSSFLGEISYGLYLLHPIVWGVLHRGLGLSIAQRMVCTIPCSAAVAWLLLKVYEQPVRRWILSLNRPIHHTDNAVDQVLKSS